jgi:hypothetical protein
MDFMLPYLWERVQAAGSFVASVFVLECFYEHPRAHIVSALRDPVLAAMDAPLPLGVPAHPAKPSSKVLAWPLPLSCE